MPTPAQLLVHRRHTDTLVFKKTAAVVKELKRGSGGQLSHYVVTTTKYSRALIAIADMKDKLPYNPHSEDPENPWLMNSYFPESDDLFFQEMNDYWQNNAKVPVDWGICPFRVYEWDDLIGDWRPCDLEVNYGDRTVRARVRDQNFWCHPPRPFQVLKNSCTKRENGNEYKQTLGNFKNKVNKFAKVDTDESIPDKRKPDSKEKLKNEIKDAFNTLFNMVLELPWEDNNQLTSYRYPTIQMEADLDYADGAERNPSRNRASRNSLGRHAANDNAVHHRLEKEGTEPVPKPTKEEFWDWLVKDLKLENVLSYKEVCGNEEL